jgi:eukaryotic-like serine/threonine-protein kinase
MTTGRVLGSYQLNDKLGEGGMGVVYTAHHLLIGRKAAVKLLQPDLSANAEVVNRFFNEARAASMIQHPGLVDVFDFGIDPSGCAYIIMEYLEGESLAARLRRDALPFDQALWIVRQVAQALGAAHARKIVHRDLKPDNVFLVTDADTPFGYRVKVLDFGIAKLAERPEGSHRTRTGSVMGTPLYMSPEQCRSSTNVDARADIYSLGCMLYELVCGRVPFAGDGFGDIIGKHMYEEPEPPRQVNPQLSAQVSSIITRAMAKNVTERFQTMHDLSVALEGVSGSFPAAMRSSYPNASSNTTLSRAAAEAVGSRRRRAPLLVAGILGVALAGAAIFLVVSSGKTPQDKPPEVDVAAALPPPPPLAPVASAPVKVKLLIESSPSGAEIYRTADGVRLGLTPYTLSMLPSDGDLVFTLKLAGHADARIEIPASRDGRAVAELKPLPPSPTSAPVSRPSSRVRSQPASQPGERILDPFGKR